MLEQAPDRWDFEEKEANDLKWLESRPVCDICGEPIQDDFYFDIGDCVCEDCLYKFYKVDID